jgi:hypothetical protein
MGPREAGEDLGQMDRGEILGRAEPYEAFDLVLGEAGARLLAQAQDLSEVRRGSPARPPPSRSNTRSPNRRSSRWI